MAAPPMTQRLGSPPPWADEVATRDKPRACARRLLGRAGAASRAPPDRPARRNLLFATKRRDRSDGAAASRDADRAGSRAEGVVRECLAEPLASERRGRSPRTCGRRVTAGRAEANGGIAAQAEASAARPKSRAARDPKPPPGVTVIKSGEVDGMAYTLYSDGSIEAQLPAKARSALPRSRR